MLATFRRVRWFTKQTSSSLLVARECAWASGEKSGWRGETRVEKEGRGQERRKKTRHALADTHCFPLRVCTCVCTRVRVCVRGYLLATSFRVSFLASVRPLVTERARQTLLCGSYKRTPAEAYAIRLRRWLGERVSRTRKREIAMISAFTARQRSMSPSKFP